ncbi:MAG: immunoglobulin domain-containing protein [bacterium]
MKMRDTNVRRQAALILGLGVLCAAPRGGRAAAPVVTPLGDLHAALSAPARVAAAPNGIVYVADPDAGQIVAFDAFGRLREVRSGFDGPLAVAVDGSGRILVGESGPGSVSAFDAGWNFLFKLGSGDGEFASPGFIAIDPVPGHDTVYVSDGTADDVGVYSNGTLAFTFGTYGTGNGQFDFPAGVFATTNEILVVDQNNDRVQVFDHGGSFLRTFTLVTTNESGPIGGRSQGILADDAGRIYVADAFQGFIRVFDATGGLLSTIGSIGEAPGQFHTPSDLAIDPCGRLLVASPNNRRVELLGLDDYIHLTASPADATLPAGTNLVLSVFTSGAGPFSYQWRKGTTNLVDGGGVSGATNSTLTLSGLATSDAGSYSVVVTGPSGTIQCGAADLAVLTPPSIVIPPAGQVVAQGSNVLLSVTAAGDALTYQWFFNGAPLGGATNATLALNAAQPEGSGNYVVTVQNAVGEATSDPAALVVLAPPVILLQPSDQKALLGDIAIFSVAAGGDELSYIWTYAGVPFLAPSDPTLVLVNVQTQAAGFYAVIVTNAIGAVTSDIALLSVFIPPAMQEVEAVSRQADGSLLVHLAGDTGYTFAIDASIDLQDWIRMTNLPSQTGLFEYLDTDATNAPSRFYRTRWRP